eukprot:c7859_g1_i1.p1 GENE.c7859_g1_i1~~c7859_g1_i1.p1  ORF type:complete len:227 (-),score=52.35 c7859_g1_i1:119-799(-)
MWVWILAFLAVAVVAYFFVFRSSKKLNTVLICGPCGAGKTCMFVQLKEGVFPTTQTSMAPQEGEFVFTGESENANKVHLVSFPGHSRLRSGLRDFLPITRCIVFVVDSLDVSSQARQYADFLYDLLTDPTVLSGKIRMLIACNKQDAAAPLPPAFIQKTLEKELDHVRKARTSMSTQGSEGETMYLGIHGEAFQFSQAACDVQFVSCSSTTREGLNTVVTWIRDAI